MDSKVRHQFELLPSQQPHVEAVTPDLIARVARRPTFLSAWNYAQDISGLEDKYVSEQVGIEGSHWTKIKKGNASPPGDERFNKYFHVLQTKIPAIWIVEKVLGCDFMSLRPHRSNLERENERLRQDNAEKDRFIQKILEHR